MNSFKIIKDVINSLLLSEPIIKFVISKFKVTEQTAREIINFLISIINEIFNIIDDGKITIGDLQAFTRLTIGVIKLTKTLKQEINDASQ